MPISIIIIDAYHANILVNELQSKTKKQRRRLIAAGVIIQHDNASAHTSHLVLSAIRNLKYELLDLSLGDYFRFPVSKDYLKGRNYRDRISLGSSVFM
jgi:hypothetical protein